MRIRQFGIALALVFGTVCASFADEGDAPFRPQWSERPTASTVARTYPPEAIRKEQGGIAAACCAILDDGRLDCKLALEWPKGMGFGEAALELSRHYRLDEQSVAEFRQRQPELYKLTIPFTMEPMSEETRVLMDRANGDRRPA